MNFILTKKADDCKADRHLGLWKLNIPKLSVLALTKRHVGSGNEIGCCINCSSREHA